MMTPLLYNGEQLSKARDEMRHAVRRDEKGVLSEKKF